MLKLMGGLLVISSGALAWYFQMSERRRKRDTLSDFQTAFRRMGENVRMARTSLPSLLKTLSADCGPEASAFFEAASRAAGEGEALPQIWRRQAKGLTLDERDKTAISDLGRDLQGDEESVCKAISHVTFLLAKSEEEMERKRPEEEKRATALWFSAAALLVILLL